MFNKKIMPIKSIKIILLVSIGAGVLFILSSLLCNCSELDNSLYIGFFGLFVGILVAPEVEKKLIKHKAAYHLFFGALFGIATAYIFGAGIDWYFVALLGGGLFGLATPVWYHGIHLPC